MAKTPGGGYLLAYTGANLQLNVLPGPVATSHRATSSTLASMPTRAHPIPSGELAALGPFFAVSTHDPGAAVRPPWRPLRELIDRPDRLDARIESVRAALAGNAGRPADDLDRRVAVSVAQLGLVARLLAPTIAVAALGFAVGTGPDDLWWQDELGGPFPLSVSGGSRDGLVAGGAPPGGGSAVELLTAAIVDRYPIAPRVVWGNVASAANSAARLVAAARPELASAARDAADAVLADPRVEDGRLRAGPSFRRRSCCLIYRLSDTPGAVCGDCVLTAR